MVDHSQEQQINTIVGLTHLLTHRVKKNQPHLLDTLQTFLQDILREGNHPSNLLALIEQELNTHWFSNGANDCSGTYYQNGCIWTIKGQRTICVKNEPTQTYDLRFSTVALGDRLHYHFRLHHAFPIVPKRTIINASIRNFWLPIDEPNQEDPAYSSRNPLTAIHVDSRNPNEPELVQLYHFLTNIRSLDRWTVHNQG